MSDPRTIPISHTRNVSAARGGGGRKGEGQSGRRSLSDEPEGETRDVLGISGSSRLETDTRTSSYGLSSSCMSAMMSPLERTRWHRRRSRDQGGELTISCPPSLHARHPSRSSTFNSLLVVQLSSSSCRHPIRDGRDAVHVLCDPGASALVLCPTAGGVPLRVSILL